MITLRPTQMEELDLAMAMIDAAKVHLHDQGIDQWQDGYPNRPYLEQDITQGKGFFAVDGQEILGYLCIDFGGDPSYDDIEGQWDNDLPYVVVHRMAFSPLARGRGLSGTVFNLVEDMAVAAGIYSFRVDTDQGNKKMQHILKKQEFTYRGVILFDNSEKIAFDKKIP